MSGNQETVLGLDLGSTGVRALALTRSGRVFTVVEAKYPTSTHPIGEADPSLWLDAVVKVVADVGITPLGVGVGGQGPTTVSSDGRRALTFRHPAGASGSFPDQQLAQAETLRSMLGDSVRPRQLWDWVVTELGGGDGMQSVWPGALALAGFGEAVTVGTVAGVSAGSQGLQAGVPLVGGCHDGAMTAWAAGIDQPGKGFDPGGATGGLGIAIDAREHPRLAGLGMGSHAPGVAIVGGPVAAHGSMLEWWSRITGRSVADLVELAAGVPPGSHGVMVLPFFEGERAPRWNPQLRAEILGLSIDHGPAVVARALLEAAAYGLAHIALTLAADGVGLDRVVSSGLPARDGLWPQIKSAVLGVPIDVPDCDQMAAYGAALTAGAGLGWWPRPGTGSSGDWPTPAMSTIVAEPLAVYRDGVRRFVALGDAAEARLGAPTGQDPAP